jgi:hypothetical protein
MKTILADRFPLFLVVCLALPLFVGLPLHAQDILNPVQNEPGCMGPDDPFCGSGGIYDGNGDGGSGTCQYCEIGSDFKLSCETPALGEPGNIECNATSDGLSCTQSGSGCTRI